VDRREVRFDLKDKAAFNLDAVKTALKGQRFSEVELKSGPR
jgi:hypothetical protein